MLRILFRVLLQSKVYGLAVVIRDCRLGPVKEYTRRGREKRRLEQSVDVSGVAFKASFRLTVCTRSSLHRRSVCSVYPVKHLAVGVNHSIWGYC